LQISCHPVRLAGSLQERTDANYALAEPPTLSTLNNHPYDSRPSNPATGRRGRSSPLSTVIGSPTTPHTICVFFTLRQCCLFCTGLYDLHAKGSFRMTRLSIGIGGIVALVLAVSAPARADYAVVRSPNGYCDIIWIRYAPAPARRVRSDWTIIAIKADWWSAVVEREWAWTVGDCKPL
jgi:hypothetical protein